jgi:DNA-binding transcriptional LysR family regulator
MTLEQLRIFVAVAEHLHVTRAAQALNLTQSAASAAIQALEARHATKLFHRVGRGIVLTDAGTAFLPEARGVLARAALAERALDDLSGMRRGFLALHASQTIANYWLPPLMHRFRTQHPGLQLDLTIGNTTQVAEAVTEGRADLGFVEGDLDIEGFEHSSVPGDRLVMVVGASHPWAGERMIAPARFAESAWVLRERGSGTRQVFEAAVQRFGSEVRVLQVGAADPGRVFPLLMHADGAVHAVVDRPGTPSAASYCTAVASSCPFIRKQPSPAAAITTRSGCCAWRRRRPARHSPSRRWSAPAGCASREAVEAVEPGGVVAGAVADHGVTGQPADQPAHDLRHLHRAGRHHRLLPGLVIGAGGAHPVAPGGQVAGRGQAAQGGGDRGGAGIDRQLGLVDLAQLLRPGMDMDQASGPAPARTKACSRWWSSRRDGRPARPAGRWSHPLGQLRIDADADIAGIDGHGRCRHNPGSGS